MARPVRTAGRPRPFTGQPPHHDSLRCCWRARRADMGSGRSNAGVGRHLSEQTAAIPAALRRTLDCELLAGVQRARERLAGRVEVTRFHVWWRGDVCRARLVCRPHPGRLPECRVQNGAEVEGSALRRGPPSRFLLQLTLASALADAVERGGWGLSVFRVCSRCGARGRIPGGEPVTPATSLPEVCAGTACPWSGGSAHGRTRSASRPAKGRA